MNILHKIMQCPYQCLWIGPLKMKILQTITWFVVMTGVIFSLKKVKTFPALPF